MHNHRLGLYYFQIAVKVSLVGIRADNGEAEEADRRPPLPARVGAAIPRLLRMELGTR